MIQWTLMLSLIGCFASADVAQPQVEDLASPRSTRVEVAVLNPSTARMERVLPGEVIGKRDVILAAGNGGQVERVHVRRGQAVRQGQAIASVDVTLFAAQVDQAEAQASQAAAALERQQALGDLASPAALEAAQTNAVVAEATARQARARLARAAISAPFDGVVADIDVEVGGHLPPGGPVARVVQLDPVRVTLSVADRDVVSLREGDPVQVQTNAVGGIHQGEITHVGPAADLRTRSFPVEVTVPNPDGLLLPGMITQVSLSREIATESVVLPQEWIVTTRKEQGVFLHRDGAAVWQPITLGEVAGDQVVILSGLSHGDQVVVTGHRELKDGESLLVSRIGACCTEGRATWGEE